MEHLPQQVECCDDMHICRTAEAKKDGILFQEKINV